VRLSRHVAVMAAVGAVLLATAAGGKPSPFPSFSAPLVDTVHVVPGDLAQQIDAQLTDYQQRTGNQIAVAIVHTTGNDALEDYSIKLASQSTPGWLVFVIIAGLILFVILGQVGRRRRWPGFGGGFAGPIFWGGGGGFGGGGFGGGGGGGFGGGGGGGFGGGGASGGW